MPNYTFKCPRCFGEETHFMSYTEFKETMVFCSPCYQRLVGNNSKGELAPVMERVLKATSTALQVNEIIDNGLQSKRIEQPAGAAEMIRQRSEDNDKP